MGVHVDAERPQAAKILVLHVVRRWLQDHLELVVVLEPVGVLAVAAVAGTPRGLHVGRAPRLRPQAAQRGRGMEGAGADLHVVGLQDDAAALRPIGLQAKDERLERPVATVGVHRRPAIRMKGRADNAPRLGSGQPRGCPAVAAGACVSGCCRRCSGAPRARAAPRALALARTRPIALKPNQTAAISTTRISSFIGLNMSYAPVGQRGESRQQQARRRV